MAKDLQSESVLATQDRLTAVFFLGIQGRLDPIDGETLELGVHPEFTEEHADELVEVGLRHR